MFKAIELGVTNVVIPDSLTIQAIHYEINRSLSFDGEVILDLETTNVEIRKNHNFLDDEVVYARVTMSFTNNKTWKSNVLSISADSFYNSDIQVYPPRVILKKVNRSGFKQGALVATINPPVFFKGVGEWLATTWLVRDLAGNVILKREYDIVDKATFELQLRHYENIPAVIIEAKYEFNGVVTVSRGMNTFITMEDEQSFGIDNYLVISKYEENAIGVIDNKYEVESVSWRVTNSEGENVDMGTGDILISGPSCRGLDKVYLHVILHTLNHGLAENTFELEVLNEDIGFPVKLPYEAKGE